MVPLSCREGVPKPSNASTFHWENAGLRYDRFMTWDPMRDLRAPRERRAAPPRASGAPPSAAYGTPAAYVITVEVPGLARDPTDLAVEPTRLTIRGRRPARVTG